MKVYVIGSGAMGTLFASLLAEGGAEVVLVARNAEALKRINDQGVRLAGVRGERTVRVPVVFEAKADAGADLILMCVKAYDTAAAADQHIALLRSGAPVVSLQNGIGNVEAIAARIGASNVLAGTTTMGAYVIEPGVVHHAAEGETEIGEPGGGVSERSARLARALSEAGVPTTASADIKSLLWTKLCVNAGINPLTALLGVRNGALAEHAETLALQSAAVDETVAAARSLGIALDGEAMRARVLSVTRATGMNRSSMLSDLSQGRRTEIDFINGSVVQIGKTNNVATPVNEVLTNLVRALEADRGRRTSV